MQQLQGFELAAGAWERLILAPRVKNYDPHWLDELFLGGELVWGRLRPPKRSDDDDAPNVAALTRAIPISLAFREDLPWLLPPDRNERGRESLAETSFSLQENRSPPKTPDPLVATGHKDSARVAAGEDLTFAERKATMRESTRGVLTLLQQRGALFMLELRSRSGLLPSQLEEALRELAALGLVTSDTFAAIRSIDQREEAGLAPPRLARQAVAKLASRRRAVVAVSGRRRRCGTAQISRTLVPVADDSLRSGVSRFAGPRIGGTELVGTGADVPQAGTARGSSRRKVRERRGGRAVRLGIHDQQASRGPRRAAIGSQPRRVVRGFGGRSAEPDRDRKLAAANHVNAKTAFILHQGRCVAVKQSGQIEFLEPIEGALQLTMRRALQMGRRERELQARKVGTA